MDSGHITSFKVGFLKTMLFNHSIMHVNSQIQISNEVSSQCVTWRSHLHRPLMTLPTSRDLAGVHTQLPCTGGGGVGHGGGGVGHGGRGVRHGGGGRWMMTGSRRTRGFVSWPDWA